MNMKKLLAGVVGMTVLMSNVAFAAVSTTTTYKGDGTVEVKTNVSGITTPNAMVTYVLYGEKDRTDMPFNEATGEVLGTTKTKPDENNIIYIDQDNNVTGSTVFTAPGLTVGQAYGAKVIVGTDSSDDVSVPENEYTGDMYTLKLATDAADYTAEVEVNMGENYIKVYSLAEAGAEVKVPVGAECKVTFDAATGKVVTKAMVDSTELDNAGNLNPEDYSEGGVYVLSAEVQNEVAAPLITVSDPIVNIPNQVSYLVNVEHFEAEKTGLMIEIIDWKDDNSVLHRFDNLVPVQVSENENCYAIRILDKTKQLDMPDVTNGYRVTPFIVVGSDNIYAGSTSAGNTNHFTVDTDSTLSDGAVDSSETQPEGPTDEPTDESTDESTDEPAEEPVAEEPVIEEPVVEE